MFDAYVVYTLLLLFMLLSTWVYSKANKNGQTYILTVSFLIYSLVLGLRYNVGVDYLAYKDIYISQYFNDVEIGYAFLNKILFVFGAPYSSIFILVAFLQIWCFAKGIECIGKKYLPFAIFFYFTTLYVFLTLNVLRQTLAFSIFLCSIRYVADRSFIKYALTIVTAGLVHKSAFTLLPLYFILNANWLLERRFIQLCLYFLTYTMSIVFSDFLWSNFQTLALMSGYADYADSLDIIQEIQWAKEGGLGVYMWMIIDVWIILAFNKQNSYKVNKYYVAFYNLYFIGLLLSNIIAGTYFDRINIYFQNMRIVIYAMFFYNTYRSKSSIINIATVSLVMIILIVFFYMGISNKASMCAPYQFIFSNYAT